MTLKEFIANNNGKKVDFDGNYGAQCFDLFQFYNRDVVGGSFVGGEGAKDIWNTYPKNLYTKVANTPTGIPPVGSVIIWGSDYGPWGHVAIVTEANVDTFKALSQNDPIGRETHIKSYPNYNGVLGWLVPNKQVVTNELEACLLAHKEAVTKATELQKTLDEKLPYWEERELYVKKLEGAVNEKDITIKELNKEALQMKKELAECKSECEKLSNATVELQHALDEALLNIQNKEDLRQKWYNEYKATEQALSDANKTIANAERSCTQKINNLKTVDKLTVSQLIGEILTRVTQKK